MNPGLVFMITFSAFWVYKDLSANGEPRDPSKKGLFNMSAGSWAIGTLFLWIVVFPVYLAKRKEIKADSKNRQGPKGRKLKMALLLIFALAATGKNISKYDKVKKTKKEVSRRLNNP